MKVVLFLASLSVASAAFCCLPDGAVCGGQGDNRCDAAPAGQCCDEFIQCYLPSGVPPRGDNNQWNYQCRGAVVVDQGATSTNSAVTTDNAPAGYNPDNYADNTYIDGVTYVDPLAGSTRPPTPAVIPFAPRPTLPPSFASYYAPVPVPAPAPAPASYGYAYSYTPSYTYSYTPEQVYGYGYYVSGYSSPDYNSYISPDYNSYIYPDYNGYTYVPAPTLGFSYSNYDSYVPTSYLYRVSSAPGAYSYSYGGNYGSSYSYSYTGNYGNYGANYDY